MRRRSRRGGCGEAEDAWIELLSSGPGLMVMGSPDCTPGYYNFEGEFNRRQDGNYNGGFKQYVESMATVRETKLPGVGVRREFTTESGEDVAVLVHNDGRREVLVYDTDDPDVCRTVMALTRDDTSTLNELLGARRVTEVVTAVQQEIEGLRGQIAAESRQIELIDRELGAHDWSNLLGRLGMLDSAHALGTFTNFVGMATMVTALAWAGR